jgi:hypothetical protein
MNPVTPSSIERCWNFIGIDGDRSCPQLGGRRDTCKKRHVVNKYCKQSLVDLLTCPKMILDESNFCTVKPSFHHFLSLTLAHK